MVCFWNVGVNTLHKGDKYIDNNNDDDDDDNGNNNNNSILILLCLIKSELIIKTSQNKRNKITRRHPSTHTHTQKEPNITNSKKVEIYNWFSTKIKYYLYKRVARAVENVMKLITNNLLKLNDNLQETVMTELQSEISLIALICLLEIFTSDKLLIKTDLPL